MELANEDPLRKNPWVDVDGLLLKFDPSGHTLRMDKHRPDEDYDFHLPVESIPFLYVLATDMGKMEMRPIQLGPKLWAKGNQYQEVNIGGCEGGVYTYYMTPRGICDLVRCIRRYNPGAAKALARIWRTSGTPD